MAIRFESRNGYTYTSGVNLGTYQGPRLKGKSDIQISLSLAPDVHVEGCKGEAIAVGDGLPRAERGRCQQIAIVGDADIGRRAVAVDAAIGDGQRGQLTPISSGSDGVGEDATGSSILGGESIGARRLGVVGRLL